MMSNNNIRLGLGKYPSLRGGISNFFFIHVFYYHLTLFEIHSAIISLAFYSILKNEVVFTVLSHDTAELNAGMR